jgi:hypothetical protein
LEQRQFGMHACAHTLRRANKQADCLICGLLHVQSQWLQQIKADKATARQEICTEATAQAQQTIEQQRATIRKMQEQLGVLRRNIRTFLSKLQPDDQAELLALPPEDLDQLFSMWVQRQPRSASTKP